MKKFSARFARRGPHFSVLPLGLQKLSAALIAEQDSRLKNARSQITKDIGVGATYLEKVACAFEIAFVFSVIVVDEDEEKSVSILCEPL